MLHIIKWSFEDKERGHSDSGINKYKDRDKALRKIQILVGMGYSFEYKVEGFKVEYRHAR